MFESEGHKLECRVRGGMEERMKISKGAVIAAIAGAISLLVLLGHYLYNNEIHVPRWITFPYDVTTCCGEARINEYLSNKKEFSIPDKILGCKVVSVDADAFNRIGKDAVVTDIPEGIWVGKVYHQESQSFYLLQADDAVMLKYIGNEKKIEIPDEVWGRSVKIIYDTCFEGTNVEGVYIPETVEGIRERAFAGCTKLEQVILPLKLKEIRFSAFEGCRNLKQIELPFDLEVIGARAFCRSGIENIEFPESVKLIGYCAFEDSALKTLSGGENVECVGNYAFRGTAWEENYEGDFVCLGDTLCLYKGEEKVVVIPSTVKKISGAFGRRSGDAYPIKVEKVFIPRSVTVISYGSFAKQRGAEVYIPTTVKDLGEGSIFGDDYGYGTIVTLIGSTAARYADRNDIDYRIITSDEMKQQMEEAMEMKENADFITTKE